VSQLGARSHLLALFGTLAAALLLVPLARRRPGPWLVVTRLALGVFLIVNEVGYEVVLASQGRWSAAYALPLYLCDAGAFITGVALIWPKRRLVEITWFWALAGTSQGLLTPDQVLAFPSYDWLQFYGDHGGVVVAALLLVIGMGIHPARGAVLRVLTITIGFGVLAGIGDLVTGGNYMYLRSVPGQGSLLNVLGPWPWYIASTAGLALVLFTALDAPFWPERRRQGSQDMGTARLAGYRVQGRGRSPGSTMGEPGNPGRRSKRRHG
jgi:hypothetical integral membrane protein (TIGR02206 family)